MKKVSIIMATYNTQIEYLDCAINSILNQTYKNIELIIVCDGSKEEFNYIKSKYEDKRIKLILNNKNMGLPYSLNKGVVESTGYYIARMDSDDISLPNRIEKQVKFLMNHKDISLCSTYARLFGDDKGLKTVPFTNPEEVKIQLLFRAVLIHPTVMGERKIFEKYKYDEKYKCSQDFELWSRVSNEFNIQVIPFVGLNYRVHNKQISKEKNKQQTINSKKIIKYNTSKIMGKYDDRIFETLYILSGRKKINKNNYLKVSNDIDYIIKINNFYNKKKLKKVLYNRFFELVISERIICKNISSLKKIIKPYNIFDLAKKIINQFE